MLEIIVLPLLTCKETRAAIIALHKNGFTGKNIVATKIASKSTIYRIIKNFKERGSILDMNASGRPRKSSKHQDRLLKRIQLRDRSATSAERAQEWQQAGVSASARTVRRRLLEDGLVSRGAARSQFSPKKPPSGADWSSTESMVNGLLRTGAKSYSRMKPVSDCLGHLEKGLSGEEKESATISPVSGQQQSILRPLMCGVASHPREWAHSQFCP